MKIVVHIPTIEAVPEARTAAEATLQEGDELEIIVAGGVRPAEPQPQSQAVGHPVQVK